MSGGDEPWKDFQTASADHEVVIAAAEVDAAHLHDTHAAALSAVFDRQLLEQHHPMRNRMQLEIVAGSGEIVQQDHGALPARKEVLECEHLAPITKGTLRK